MMARVLAVGTLSLVMAACSGGAGASPMATGALTEAPATVASSPAPDAVELTIYGAASLKGALEEAGAAYEAVNPDTDLVIAADSSAALETQIEQGAPADVFLSADTANPRKLVDKGLADGAPVTFARNELTVIVPKENPAGIQSPADLAKPGTKIIAAGDEVPITKYAMQLIDNLARETGYPADFAAAYAANVVSREDNVKSVVAKVGEFVEGDAGIVYVTDAKASDEVLTVPTPPGANVPATYDGVVVKASAHAAEARAFLEWLAGPEGQAILGELGFLPPS
jgi:molybdate transport system substrate-binding protein